VPNAHYIELIGKTVGILETLRDNPDGLSLQDLAAQTRQVKSSVHRTLRSLMHHGYVEQDTPGSAYRLGLQILVLARGVRTTNNLVELARPYTREFMETFDESTYLAVLRHGRGIFLDVQETRRDLRLVGPLGAEVHFHATAAGKVIAAFFPKDQMEDLLKTLRQAPLTKRTLLSRSQIEREWAMVRKRGYASNDEETIVGAIFLAAPIFDAAEKICGSISIGVPKPRYSTKLGERIISHLTNSCRRLSDALKAVHYVHENGFLL
jgi:IclR family acetate operon transcriptional repressor